MGTLPRARHKLKPPNSDSGRPGGLSAWLFPACHKPTLARSRYAHVHMEFSVRLQHLVSLPAYRGQGSAGDAASDLTATTGVGSAVFSGGGSSSVGSEMRHDPYREFSAVPK